MCGATCIGVGQTEEPWTLRVEQGYPAVMDHGDGIEPRHHIMGEVYEVDAELLAALDAFEDHPIMYERRLARIRLNRKGTAPPESVEAWLYFYNLPPHGPLWPSGDIMEL